MTLSMKTVNLHIEEIKFIFVRVSKLYNKICTIDEVAKQLILFHRTFCGNYDHIKNMVNF